MRSLLVVTFFTLSSSLVQADDWPQWLGPQRDGVWRETGIIDQMPAGGPTALWRVPCGAGYAGPAVADGKVFLHDRVLNPGVNNPANVFGRDKVEGTERVVCLDEATGKLIWKHEYTCVYAISYASGPRCTPTVHEGKVYALGAMGDLLCLDANSGEVIWSKILPNEYDAPIAMWGFAGHPLIEGANVITFCGGPGALACAWDAKTGKEQWRLNLPESDGVGYAPPMAYTFGNRRVVVLWHAEGVSGVEPASGKLLWNVPWKLKAGMSIATPIHYADGRLFLSCFYNGSMMLQVDADRAKIVWKGKQWKPGRGSEMPENSGDLQSVMATPYPLGDLIVGLCSYGQMRAIKAMDGSRVWEDLRPARSVPFDDKEKPERWGHAFLTPQNGHWWLFTEKGDLALADIDAQGYHERGRAHLLEPSNNMAMGRLTVWTHPAFANKCLIVRNDKEIARFQLAK